MFQGDKPATDLYSEGIGFAKVIDLSRMDKNAQLAAQQEATEEARKQRAEDHLNSELQTKLMKFKDGAIREADKADYAAMQDKYVANVLSAHAKAKNGKLSTADELALGKELNGINNFLDQSTKEGVRLEAMMRDAKGMKVAGQGVFNEDDLSEAYNMPISKMEGGTSLNYAPIPKGDIQREYNKTMIPQLIERKQATGDAVYNADGSVTYNNVQIIDPEAFKQSVDDFENSNGMAHSWAVNSIHYDKSGKLKEKYIDSNAEDPMKGYNQLLHDVIRPPAAKVTSRTTAVPAPPSGSSGSASAPKAVVTEKDNSTEVYTPLTKVETIDVGDKQYNVNSVHSEFDKEGNIIGGYAIDSDIAAENNKNAIELTKQNNLLNKELAKIKKDFTTERDEAAKSEKNAVDLKYKTLFDDITYRRSLLVDKYPTDLEEKIQLPQQQVIELQSGKLGVHPQQVASGEAKDKVKITVNDERTNGKSVSSQPKMTATEWNTKWGTLKSGQQLVGLDGKTYTKK